MDEQPGLSEQYRTSSPWPLIVVLGVVFSELGVLFGVFPITVGGLLILVGSVAGILQESGYAERPWPTLVGLGVVAIVLGGVLALTQLGAIGVDGIANAVLAPQQNGIVARGVALAVAGVLAASGGVLGRALDDESI